MGRAYIDIETYCDTDIRESNVYRYAEDPSFEILMMAYAVDDDRVELVLGDEVCRAKFSELYGAGHTMVAANAGFERVCFSPPSGPYLPPERWDDPLPRALAYGYPGKLGTLAKALGVSEKDDEGQRLIGLFSKPQPKNRKRRRLFAEDRPEDWRMFCDYCVQDVEVLRDCDRELRDFPAKEREVWLLDQKLNDKGVPYDVEMAEAAVEVNDRLRDEAVEEMAVLLDVENPRSVRQVTEALAGRGLVLDSLNKETVDKALADPRVVGELRRALELRRVLALSAAKKYEAGLRTVNRDGRVRGNLAYFGGHTGRWAGRSLQLQNLPREGLSPIKQAAAIQDLKFFRESDPQTLKALIRASVPGPVTVVDYSGIESRVLAWLAGEQWVLDAYARGEDLYVSTASRMGLLGEDGRPDRSKGKPAVLGCGYGGGPNALRNVGAKGTEEELSALADAWRDANPNIVNFWFATERAFLRTGRINDKLSVQRARHQGRAMILPSGRPMCYRFLERSGKSVSYLNRHGQRVRTWRGGLAENLTQGVARDLLAEALLRLDAAGYDVIVHVHDEVVIAGEHDVEEVARIMCDAEPWAEGLPLNAEGGVIERYGKP